MMKKLATMTLIPLLCCSAVTAGSLDTQKVAADAKWVAHLDVEALLKSAIGKFILGEAEKKDSFIDGIAKIREALGFDPLTDVRGITLYGKKFGDESGVVLFDATVDQQKLLTLLEANEGHKTIQYGDYTLHEWIEAPKQPKGDDEGLLAGAGKTKFGCFYGQKLVVIASSVELLKGAIDVLDGKGENLAKSKGLAMLPKSADGEFLVVAAEQIELPAKASKPKTALARNITDAAAQLGEVKGVLFLNISVVTKTAEKATQLCRAAQGLIAIGQLGLQEDPNAPVLGEKIEVTPHDTTAHLSATMPTESFIKLLKYLAAKKRAKGQMVRLEPGA